MSKAELENRYGAHNEVQTLHIPFHIPERGPCSIEATVWPNEDPKRYGHGLITDGPGQKATGCPIIRIKVNSHEMKGYAAMYGWIQLVATGDVGDWNVLLPSDLSKAPWVMDPVHITDGLDYPFTWFGEEPTLFDAPGQPNNNTLDWVSRSFLCYLDDPVGNRREKVQIAKPILAIEWGFWMDDYKPYVKEVKQVDIAVWNEHLDLYRSKFKGWSFPEVSSS